MNVRPQWSKTIFHEHEFVGSRMVATMYGCEPLSVGSVLEHEMDRIGVYNFVDMPVSCIPYERRRVRRRPFAFLATRLILVVRWREVGIDMSEASVIWSAISSMT